MKYCLCLVAVVSLRGVLVFSGLRYVLLSWKRASFYISSIELLSYRTIGTGRQFITLISPAAHFIYIHLILVGSYTAWQVLRWSSPTYVLAYFCSNDLPWQSSYSPHSPLFFLLLFSHFFSYSLHFEAHALLFQLPCSWQWIHHCKNLLGYTSRRLMTSERLFRFTRWQLTTICTSISIKDWDKSRIQIILCVTLMRQTSTSWTRLFASISRTRRRIMTVWFSSTISTEGAIYATAVNNVDGLKLLEDVYFIFMLDGRHWRDFSELPRDEDGVE